MKLDLNGGALTLCDLELIVGVLERDGSIEVIGARRGMEGSTLLRLGAFLAEGAKNAVRDKKVKKLNGGYVAQRSKK